jgi:glucan 1,3-beta-glucosidase
MAQPSSNAQYTPILGQTALPQEDYGFHAPQPQYYDAPSAMQSMSSLSPSARPYDSVHGLGNGARDSQFSAFQPYRDDPRGTSASHLPMDDRGPARPQLTEKRAMYTAPREQSKKRLTLIIVAVVVVLLIAAAIGLPLYFAVLRPKSLAAANNNSNKNSNSDNSSSDNTSNEKPNNLITWGGDESLVEMEDGNKFTYSNKFGGYWVFDPANPTNNSARAQSFSPALNEEFKYGVDRIRGWVDPSPQGTVANYEKFHSVNIGGWLNMEPFITPEYYEEFYPNAVDEWTLSQQLQAKYGNLDKIENHYKTFIVSLPHYLP